MSTVETLALISVMRDFIEGVKPLILKEEFAS